MLAKLMMDKMNEQGLTMSAVAGEIGISRSSLYRFVDGAKMDMDTLDAIARWVNVPLMMVLKERMGSDEESFMSGVAMLSAMDPEFKSLLQEMFLRVSNNEMDPNVLSDVVAYARFKLSQLKSRGNTNEAVQPNQPEGSGR
jgi:transcriptional regulator with XRE-family HTH domain